MPAALALWHNCWRKMSTTFVSSWVVWHTVTAVAFRVNADTVLTLILRAVVSICTIATIHTRIVRVLVVRDSIIVIVGVLCVRNAVVVIIWILGIGSPIVIIVGVHVVGRFIAIEVTIVRRTSWR